MATLRIHRFVEGRKWVQDYTVEVTKGMTVLEALISIKEHQDPTLSFTCSCRSSICGACAVRVNGNAELSCEKLVADLIARYQTETLTVEPLGNFRVRHPRPHRRLGSEVRAHQESQARRPSEGRVQRRRRLPPVAGRLRQIQEVRRLHSLRLVRLGVQQEHAEPEGLSRSVCLRQGGAHHGGFARQGPEGTPQGCPRRRPLALLQLPGMHGEMPEASRPGRCHREAQGCDVQVPPRRQCRRAPRQGDLRRHPGVGHARRVEAQHQVGGLLHGRPARPDGSAPHARRQDEPPGDASGQSGDQDHRSHRQGGRERGGVSGQLLPLIEVAACKSELQR